MHGEAGRGERPEVQGQQGDHDAVSFTRGAVSSAPVAQRGAGDQVGQDADLALRSLFGARLPPRPPDSAPSSGAR